MLGFGSQTGRTSRTGQTSPICPRTNTDSCPFAPFVKIRGLNSVKNLLTFPLPQTPQSRARKGEREQCSFLTHQYNKAVGRFPYCIGGHYKEVHQHNKGTDGEDKDTFHQKGAKKGDGLIKFAPLAGFRAIFIF